MNFYFRYFICRLIDTHERQLMFSVYGLIKIQVLILIFKFHNELFFVLACFICATCDGIRIFNVEPFAQKSFLGIRKKE
jgi:hypothetical protein